MIDVNEKYKFNTIEESIINKDWAVGSKEITDSTEIIYQNDKFILKDLHYAKALVKIIDEPIVNAIDHYIRNLTQVKNIKLNISEDEIVIYNDGPGIEVVIHDVISEHLKKQMYVPTMIFSITFQGSNKINEGIIGGTNGLGIKSTNCLSKKFTIETVDSINKKYFSQTWFNSKTIENDPIIKDSTEKPYVKVCFTPDYKYFKYMLNEEDSNLLDKDRFNDLKDIIYSRLVFASLYAKTCNVYFNDNLIKIKHVSEIMKDIAAVHIDFTMDCNISGFPWEVSIGIDSDVKYNISVVNGILVRQGKHFDYINRIIKNKFAEKFKKLTNGTVQIKNNISIICNMKFNNASWTGQNKDTLDNKIDSFSNYTIPKNKLDLIIKELEQYIHIPEKRTKKIKNIDPTKYTPAINAGKSLSHKCVLLIAEGDSAKTQLQTGVSSLPESFNFYGIMTLGGVIINARKEVKETLMNSKNYKKYSNKFKNNLFIKMFTEICNIDINYNYDPNDSMYSKKMKALNYGSIILCVDQDLDGKGNILGLFISNIELLWPNLISNGYIKWFSTPIIRAYPKTKKLQVKSFYTEEDYENNKNSLHEYDIKYYKGLGSHSRVEVIDMFSKIKPHTFTFTLDDKARETFNIYYGTDSELRKKELKKSILDIEYKKPIDNFIDCSSQLKNETFLYQKDNLERKLDNIIDGQNQSGRMILNGILNAFKKNNKEIKTTQLAGAISKSEDYHHGEASLSTTLTGKAFINCGGKQLPFILPNGNFGSRNGSDAANPRYTYCLLNKKLTSLLFPEEDYTLLSFEETEGKRRAPKYFIPTLPLAIMESIEIPAHGWKEKIWARDYVSVINNILLLITHNDNYMNYKLPNLQLATYKGAEYEWKGKLRYVVDKLFSFGTYEMINNKLHVTELPLRVWTTNYIGTLKTKLDKYDIVQEINNKSSDIKVNIQIVLKKGVTESDFDCYANYPYTTGIEEFFQLKNIMDDHINLFGPNKEIMSFENYNDPIKVWYPFRRDLYKKRLERDIILESLKIIYYNELIRYVCSPLELSKKKITEMELMLSKNKYQRINKTILFSPGFTETENIRKVVLDGDYNYILNLTEANKSEENLNKLKNKLSECQERLQKLESSMNDKYFPGSQIWIDTLYEMKSVIKEGLRTSWRFENKYEFE